MACCNNKEYNPALEVCANRLMPTSDDILPCSSGHICPKDDAENAACGICSFDIETDTCRTVSVNDSIQNAAQEVTTVAVLPPVQQQQCIYVSCKLDENVCGSTCHGPNHVCCSGKIYERASTRRCCGTSYLPRANGDVCCGNTLHPAKSGYTCCGARYIAIPQGSICCDGLIVAGNTCCGSIGYDSSIANVSCCDGILLEVNYTTKCCGASVVSANQVCCNGVSYSPKTGHTCCGTAYVRDDSSLCCTANDGAVKAHIYSSASALLLAAPKCCGVNVIPSHLGCCNNEAFDPSKFVCADRSNAVRGGCGAGRLCPLDSADKAFCDLCTFDTTEAVCAAVFGSVFVPECRGMPSIDYFGPDLNHTAVNLKEDTSYEVQIEAATAGGYTRSNWSTVRTLVGVLPAPRTLVLGNTSVLVSWDRPPMEFGEVIRYDLLRNSVTVFSGKLVSFEDISLIPGTTYMYEYVVVTKLTTTRSLVSNATTFTSVPSGVLKPNCTALSFSSVYISWRSPIQPNGLITEYILQSEIFDNEGVSVQLSLSEVVGNLEPAMPYRFRVLACTKTGCKASPQCIVMTNDAPPLEMSAPSTSLINSTRVLVSWAEPNQPNGKILHYIVKLLPLQVDRSEISQIYPATTKEVMVDIQPNTEYMITVVAVNSAGNATSPAVNEPKAPTDMGAVVVVPPILAHEVTLAWTGPSTFVTFFAILLRQAAADDASFVEVFRGFDTRATIDGLTPGRAYISVVVAGNAAGNTSSDPISFSTATEMSPPEQFDNLMAFAPSATSSILSWSAPLSPNGPILEYILFRSGPFSPTMNYDPDSTDPYKHGKEVSRGQERFSTDQDLRPHSRYFYTIFAVNAGGSTRGTSPITDQNYAQLTTRQALAEGLTEPAVDAGQTFLYISWGAPTELNGKLDAYILEARLVQEPTLQPVVFFEGKNEQYNLTGLEIFSQYEVRVNVRNSFGTAIGPWITAHTCGGAPIDVSAPVSDVRTATTLSLSWIIPTRPNGIDISYTLLLGNSSIYTGSARSFLV